MTNKISYRDYLLRTAASTVEALTDAMRKALDMEHEEVAIQLLENRLDSVRLLAEYKRPNPERVAVPGNGDAADSTQT